MIEIYTPLSISEAIKSYLDPEYSHIENLLAIKLEQFGWMYERQHKIGNYRADFYFPRNKLVLEIDGKEFHSSPEQKKHDQERDKYMNELGYPVLRVPAHIAKKNPEGVLTVVRYIYRPTTIEIKEESYLQKIIEIAKTDARSILTSEKF